MNNETEGRETLLKREHPRTGTILRCENEKGKKFFLGCLKSMGSRDRGQGIR
jgi:hypothetical protein